VKQYNTESKVNYRKALEKIHISTEAQTKDKQTNNEVMMMMMMIIQFNSILIYFRADLTA
jgi:hypothetical protein